MKALIVNADDFGLTRGVNDAIIEAFERGNVTSATLMVNTAAFAHAVEQAIARPGLGVGLHFNLTLGRPVAEVHRVATLVDANGNFYSRGALARKFALRRIDGAQVALELRAQYERMAAGGLLPTHIDTHQHLHAFPLCFDAVASACQQAGIPMRMPWVLAMPGAGIPPGRRLRQWLLKRMLARNQHQWQGRVRWNSGLGSVFDLGTVPRELHIDHYARLLDAAPEGVFELMVHPARSARELEGLTRIGTISEQEARLLASADLGALARERGFTLGNYRSLWRASATGP